ncbi:MAG: DUF1993 domain-containing protein [Candidatus Paceibacterota bacterium]
MKETNLYTVTIPPMKSGLTALMHILDRAAAHAESKKTTRRSFEDALLADRIIFDQFPLLQQIQVASDNAKGGAARLAGVDVPKYDDAEKTISDLKARLEKTVAFLDGIAPEQIEGQEERKIELSYFPGKHFKAFDYATQYLMPNFYFHVVTAYAILRKNGVALGKADYLTELALNDN